MPAVAVPAGSTLHRAAEAAGGRHRGRSRVSRRPPGLSDRCDRLLTQIRTPQTPHPERTRERDERTIGRRDGPPHTAGDGPRHRVVHRDDGRPKPASLRRSLRGPVALRRDHRGGWRHYRPTQRGRSHRPARPGSVFLHVDWSFKAPIRPARRDHRRGRGPEARQDKPIHGCAPPSAAKTTRRPRRDGAGLDRSTT